MADIALYRKYRPQKFSDLVGQDHIRVTLQNAVKENALSHAYLLCGTRGTGKTSSARLIAKAVNCENPKAGEPCGKCELCTALMEGNLIDLVEIDAASNRGIDEIRDLKEKLHFAPTRGKAKVYIIDEVHMLTKEAFNALLKTLEEPPAHSYFILATTEVHKIPETIISRCQRFDFKRVGEGALIERLKYIAGEEKIKFEEEALEMIMRHVNGGMRDAIGLLEQLSGNGKILADDVKKVLGVTGSGPLKKLYQYLDEGNSAGALDLVQELFVEGQDFVVFVKEFMWFLRGEMVAKVQSGDNAGAYEALGMIEVTHQVVENMGGAPIPQLPLEAAIMKICAGKGATPVSRPVQVAEKKVEPVSSSKPKEAKKETVVEAEVNEVKAEEKEAEVSVGGGKEMTVDELQSKWKDVMEKITKPSLRMSLAQGRIDSTTQGQVSIAFGSNFHLEKVNNATDLAAIEEAFKAILGQSMKVTAILGEGPAVVADSSDQLIEKAEELFS